MIKKRKETEDINLEALGFPPNSVIYINENLCPYFRQIWGKCRKLKAAGQLKYVWTVNGIVRIKRDDSSSALKIEHITELFNMFPDFNFDE